MISGECLLQKKQAFMAQTGVILSEVFLIWLSPKAFYVVDNLFKEQNPEHLFRIQTS